MMRGGVGRMIVVLGTTLEYVNASENYGSSYIINAGGTGMIFYKLERRQGEEGVGLF
jgi:hypothetical protein